MRTRLEQFNEDIDATVELFASLEIPRFENPTEYISLTHPDEYALYEGDILSSIDGPVPPREYRRKIKEMVVPHSTAKHASAARDSYMVGALARFNNNYEQLCERAKEAAERLKLKPLCHNPYMISIAQVVECVHCAETIRENLDTLLERGLQQEDISYTPRAGRGIGAVEVPRGLLIHDYTYDSEGNIVDANCIIPTNQNHANIEYDFRMLLPQILDRSKEEITRALEMLVRAYDPCISCSTHMLEVEFVED